MGNKELKKYPKSRKEALEKGLIHYYSGIPCKWGHLSLRNSSKGTCIECKKEYSSRYWKKHPKYCANSYKRWRLNNPIKARESIRNWQKANPQFQALHYARKKQCVPKWADKEEIKYIYELAREKNLVVDHIVPMTSNRVCGLHCADNLRCIPHKLNVTKGNRYWPNMPK